MMSEVDLSSCLIHFDFGVGEGDFILIHWNFRTQGSWTIEEQRSGSRYTSKKELGHPMWSRVIVCRDRGTCASCFHKDMIPFESN